MQRNRDTTTQIEQVPKQPTFPPALSESSYGSIEAKVQGSGTREVGDTKKGTYESALSSTNFNSSSFHNSLLTASFTPLDTSSISITSTTPIAKLSPASHATTPTSTSRTLQHNTPATSALCLPKTPAMPPPVSTSYAKLNPSPASAATAVSVLLSSASAAAAFAIRERKEHIEKKQLSVRGGQNQKNGKDRSDAEKPDKLPRKEDFQSTMPERVCEQNGERVKVMVRQRKKTREPDHKMQGKPTNTNTSSTPMHTYPQSTEYPSSPTPPSSPVYTLSPSLLPFSTATSPTKPNTETGESDLAATSRSKQGYEYGCGHMYETDGKYDALSIAPPSPSLPSHSQDALEYVDTREHHAPALLSPPFSPPLIYPHSLHPLLSTPFPRLT